MVAVSPGCYVVMDLDKAATTLDGPGRWLFRHVDALRVPESHRVTMNDIVHVRRKDGPHLVIAVTMIGALGLVYMLLLPNATAWSLAEHWLPVTGTRRL